MESTPYQDPKLPPPASTPQTPATNLATPSNSWVGIKIILPVLVLLVLALAAYAFFWGLPGGRDKVTDKTGTSSGNLTASESAELNQSGCTESSRYTSLSQALAEAEAVCFLDLRGQNLTELPASIGSLVNLRYLIISNNQISRFPSQINRVTKVTKLLANNNKLEDFPTEILELRNLLVLDLSFNSIKVVPDQIAVLSNLNKLYFIDSLPQSEKDKLRRLLPDTEMFFDRPN